MIRRRVIAHGRVQGVWFRASTRDVAVSLGLSGWVRNCADGSVEAVFEGDATSVEGAVAWIRSGPERAHVEDVEIFAEEPSGEYADFSVRS